MINGGGSWRQALQGILPQVASHAAKEAAKHVERKVAERANPRRRARARPGISASALMNQPAATINRGVMPSQDRQWAQSPATSNVIAPRGFGYYDAFANPPASAMTAMSIGPATPIQGTTLWQEPTYTPGDWTSTTTLPKPGQKLIVVYPSRGDCQAVTYTMTPTAAGGTDYNPGDSVNAYPHKCPQFSTDPPIDSIPTRCSFRIRNVTEARSIGGVIRVLRATAALKMDGLTNLRLADLLQQISVNPRTRHYDAQELIDSKQKNCSVVDQSRSTLFEDFELVALNPSNPVKPFQDELLALSYTPLLIIFEPFASSANVNNTYEINIMTQQLAHYGQGTMLSAMAIDPKSGSMNKHRDTEERSGSGLLSILGGALAAGAGAVASQAGTFLPQVGKMAPMLM